MSLLDTASLVITPNGTKASKLYSVVPSSGAGDMTVTRATTATRVNSAGLIESVASNVPRLDYSNGTCPSILVEPQRTNYLTYSEQFNNATWIANEITITANNTTSPDGTQNADRALETATDAYHDILNLNASLSAGTTYTLSCFVKYAGREFIYLFISNGLAASAVKFNIQTGTVLGTALGTVVSSKIENYGNGWYRCSVVYSSAILASATLAVSTTDSPALSLAPYSGDVTKGIYVWGSQLEVGSYATSYIPTTSASVTRNADVISKTGISSLIGQTEGTVFLDYIWNSPSSDVIPIAINGNGGKFMWFRQNGVQFYGNGSSLLFSNNNVSAYGTRYKIAFAYGQNDFRIYINGSLSGVSTSGTFTGTFDDLVFTPIGSPTFNDSMKHNTIALWKTRLTNTQLAQLTTI